MNLVVACFSRAFTGAYALNDDGSIFSTEAL
jgi:hypothetical protein